MSKELSQRLSAEDALTAIDNLSIKDVNEESSDLQLPRKMSRPKELDMADPDAQGQVGYCHLKDWRAALRSIAASLQSHKILGLLQPGQSNQILNIS